MNVLVYSTSHFGAEAGQSTAHFACVLLERAQRVCEDFATFHVTASDKGREVTRRHFRLLYLEGKSGTFNSFVNEGLECLIFHLYEARKICPHGCVLGIWRVRGSNTCSRGTEERNDRDGTHRRKRRSDMA